MTSDVSCDDAISSSDDLDLTQWVIWESLWPEIPAITFRVDGTIKAIEVKGSRSSNVPAI